MDTEGGRVKGGFHENGNFPKGLGLRVLLETPCRHSVMEFPHLIFAEIKFFSMIRSPALESLELQIQAQSY